MEVSEKKGRNPRKEGIQGRKEGRKEARKEGSQGKKRREERR